MVDSRLANGGNRIKRRRECARCKERFTTYETAELTLPRVVKRDGTREPFDKAKLLLGMMRALEKRPVRSDRVEVAVQRIERKAITRGESEVPAKLIGQWVMDELGDLDRVAYVRFASVYWSFEDLDAFREVIEILEKRPTAEQKKHQIPLLPDDQA